MSVVLSHIGQDRLPGLLQQHKPKWMAEVKLHSFCLGEQPPSITSAKAYGPEGVRDAIVLDLDVTWRGDQEMQLQVKPWPKFPITLGVPFAHLLGRMLKLRVGIKNVTLTGPVRIQFRPLFSRPPIVGAVKVSFIEQPSFTYNAVCYDGDISFVPGLEAWLNGLLRDKLLCHYVLPDGWVKHFTDQSDGLEAPKGILHVKLVEAVHVPKLDWFSWVNTYVILYVRSGRLHRSITKHKTRHPRWNEEFKMLVHEPEHQQLTMVLYDHSFFHKDEELGRCMYPVSELAEHHGEMQDLWLQLGPPGDNAGQIQLLSLRTVQRTFRMLDMRAFATDYPQHRRLCQLHIQATYFRVAEEEVQASQEQVSHVPDHRHGRSGHHIDANLVSMLSGGVLLVRIHKGEGCDIEGADPLSLGHPRYAKHVRVQLGEQVKGTACAEGRPDPGEEEQLGFAVDGKLVQDAEAKICIYVYDTHWVNQSDSSLWAADPLGRSSQPLPQAVEIEIPLYEVVQNRQIASNWLVDQTQNLVLSMRLSWMSLLEAG